MPISLKQSNHLKAIAILMMLCLHLFNRDYTNLFTPIIFVGEQPLSYYISLFCDACVPIFAFTSGYGLYFKYDKDKFSYSNGNKKRIKSLYINYWIIILLFVMLLGSFLSKEGYPGSIQKIMLNISGINPSYNGAWWFFTTYVLFVLSSRFWFQLLDKINPYFYILLLALLYVIAFYFRIYKANTFDNELLNYFQTQSALCFCTLFQFMLGAFALKYKWNEKISSLIEKKTFVNNFTLIGCIILLILGHALVPNFIIAPFTALGFIFIFTQLKVSNLLSKILDFMAIHSTNLWLIHMFFYMIYFPEFVYSFEYPVVIFAVLVTLCVLSSVVVNFINNKINQWV